MLPSARDCMKTQHSTVSSIRLAGHCSRTADVLAVDKTPFLVYVNSIDELSTFYHHFAETPPLSWRCFQSRNRMHENLIRGKLFHGLALARSSIPGLEIVLEMRWVLRFAGKTIWPLRVRRTCAGQRTNE
ncbi:hypothetical protein BaRGS_00009360 [Batillaria attramentaria]|uniref:Uncharacterized protein n=1 Tax=Batillaria attramentaria TaxID=370345 RepID=A0ABD0LIS6_9CAEN